MVADALDHRGGAGVAHAEALADEAAQEDLAAGGAVADDVAGDDVVLGGERRVAVGAHHHSPTGQALADVVVGVALQRHRHARRHERTEALPGRATEVQRRWCRRADPAPPCAVVIAEPSMVPTVRLTLRIGSVERHRLAALDGRRARAQQLLVERLVEAVILRHRVVQRLSRTGSAARRGSG